MSAGEAIWDRLSVEIDSALVGQKNDSVLVGQKNDSALVVYR